MLSTSIFSANGSIYRQSAVFGSSFVLNNTALEQVGRELDLGLEEVLGVQVVSRRVAAVLLDVETNGGARRAGTRKTDDDTAS